MNLLLFWAGCGALAMVFTANRAFGRVVAERTSTFFMSGMHTTREKLEPDTLRPHFQLAFLAGLCVFLAAGTLAALGYSL